MWASAREELRRPGLSGGGGGNPLLRTTGLGRAATTAGTAIAVAGFLMAGTCALTLAGTAMVLTTGKILEATLVGLFKTPAATIFEASFNAFLSIVFAETFGTVFTAVLIATLRAGFLGVSPGVDLTNGFLSTGCVLDVGLADTLTDCLATALTGNLTGLASLADFAKALNTGFFAAFAVVFSAAFETFLETVLLAALEVVDLAGGFAAGVDAFLGLPSTLGVGLSIFFEGVFTAWIL